MRKIYSLVLMATMLLIGTNAWADGVIELVRKGNTQPEATTYTHLNAAFAAAQDGDLLRLTDDISENLDSTAWFGEPTSGTLENYASTDRSITLDLKGHKYTFNHTTNNKTANDATPKSPDYSIALTRGGLTIQSTGGEGEMISNRGVIAVYGTYLKIDAKNETPFTHLTIEENVKITSGAEYDAVEQEYKNRAVVLESPLRPYQATSAWKWREYPCDYNCEIYPVSQHGISNGARIDIKGKLEGGKYAFQVSGNIRSSKEYLNTDGTYKSGKFPLYYAKSATEFYKPCTTLEGKTETGKNTDIYYTNVQSDDEDYVIRATDDDLYSSYIHIHPTAELKTLHTDTKSSVGFYSAGYARCYVEGHCEGSTGVYVKAGEVELHDATVVSNYENQYSKPTNDGKNHGVSAGGSAIVVESKVGWSGNIEVTISGDTHVSTEHGFAIEEQVTTGGTNVNYLTITGGTFDGGQVPVSITPNAQDPTKNDTVWGQGTMYVSQPTLIAHANPDTITTITIIGGQMETTTDYVGDGGQTLADFIGGQGNTHITYVEVPDPNNPSVTKTTMVISEGPAPATADPENPEAKTPWSWCAHNDQSGKNVAWTEIEDAEIASGTITLGELQIISGTGTAAGERQQLTIKSGATLQVEHLIMNAYARIIVEAGGKLIVEGTQGIIAPKVENIVLKASESAQALFLIHPKVSSNRHPNATVEFISNSYVDAPNYAAQRFGIPTHGKLTGISAKRNNTDVETAFAYLNYAADEWTIFGYINSDKGTLDLENMKSAFGFYQMVNNTPDKGTVVTMTGELYGNLDPTLPIIANKWNGYANSYMAPIDAKKLMSMIPSSVDKSFHVYEVDAEGDGEWVAVSNLELHDVRPLQAFLLRNTHDEANVTINYAQAVYAPMVPSYTPGAPARHIENNMTMATLIVKGEMSKDRVVIAEDAQFSAEFDNGYDAAKYMNDGINLYVSADEKMAHFATDNLENTYLGFQAVNGGKYTLEFANVQGEELTLIDLENNASVIMVDGNKYEFTADANSKNDYRFKIVSTFNAPTAIENTEAAKNAKGIYTITGQFMGEMSVWNSLPAGVYVVNGEKRVK